MTCYYSSLRLKLFLFLVIYFCLLYACASVNECIYAYLLCVLALCVLALCLCIGIVCVHAFIGVLCACMCVYPCIFVYVLFV